MKIEEYKHINDLNIILRKVKYGNKLDLNNIDFFTSSLLMVDIHKMVTEKWIELLKKKGNFPDSDTEQMFFEFDNYNGEIFSNKFDNEDNIRLNQKIILLCASLTAL